MSYSAPSIIELGTLATSTLQMSTSIQTTTKDLIDNTDTGYLAVIQPGANPRPS